MRQKEYSHNTPEQIRVYLTDALALVAELDPPEDLRVICFEKAVDLHAAKQIIFEPIGVVPTLGRG
jgi:hypothetical protein